MKAVGIALLVVTGVALVPACHLSERAQSPVSSLPLLVINGPRAPEWLRLMRASGTAARVGSVADLADRSGAVVPDGAVTSRPDLQAIRSWVERGGRVATSDDGVLKALGVQRTHPQPASGVADRDGATPATWAEPTLVSPLGGGPSRPKARVRTDGGAVIAATYSLGRGGVWALGVDPLGDGRLGHELMPDVGRAVATWVRAPVGPDRNGVEVYVDPGGLHGAATGTPEQLAERLQNVRAVHIAGWNGDFRSAADNYDYARLIAALHARGILAIAWIEPPFVSLRFWEDHPECREKTQTGRDAHVDWRLLMALETPRCFALAAKVWDHLLSGFDWDGVNVAELYFEPSSDPASHTPFSKTALRAFGADPLTKPVAFLDFRTALATRLTAAILGNVSGLPGADQLELQITAIDDVLDPTLARAVGSSLTRLATVAKRAGASLQVEDPYTRWTAGPLRYVRVVASASRLMPKGASIIDLNVVGRDGARPTSAMTGAELDLAAQAAAGPSGRVAFYALGTLQPADLASLSGAVGAPAATTDSGVLAPWTTVQMAPDGAQGSAATLDGRPWPVAGGRAVVPPGEHSLRWSRGPSRGPGLRSFTGELGTASLTATGMALSYDSRGRAYAVLTCRTRWLILDERAVEAVQVPGPRDGTWVLRLPAGTHSIRQRC